MTTFTPAPAHSLFCDVRTLPLAAESWCQSEKLRLESSALKADQPMTGWRWQKGMLRVQEQLTRCRPEE
jgi:hypothetical protein